MSLAFATESILDAWDELQALARDHFAEAMGDDGKALSLDRALYAAMTAAGTLVFITAREAGRLVGYVAFFVGRHNHADQMTAMQDGIFLAPSHRNGWTADRLIAWAEAFLARRGVELVVQGSRARRDWSPVLRRRGYHLAETLWEKRLSPETST